MNLFTRIVDTIKLIFRPPQSQKTTPVPAEVLRQVHMYILVEQSMDWLKIGAPLNAQVMRAFHAETNLAQDKFWAKELTEIKTGGQVFAKFLELGITSERVLEMIFGRTNLARWQDMPMDLVIDEMGKPISTVPERDRALTGSTLSD